MVLLSMKDHATLQVRLSMMFIVYLSVLFLIEGYKIFNLLPNLRISCIILLFRIFLSESHPHTTFERSVTYKAGLLGDNLYLLLPAKELGTLNCSRKNSCYFKNPQSMQKHRHPSNNLKLKWQSQKQNPILYWYWKGGGELLYRQVEKKAPEDLISY